MLSTDVKQRRMTDQQPLTQELQRQQLLLDVAQTSIRHGLRAGQPLVVDPRAFPDELRELRATFVTLHIGNDLRGCIGTVKAVRPLVEDVAQNAFNAAFNDPRFPPLRPFEFPMLDIEVSLLCPLQPIEFSDEAELLHQIRPGVDGLELEYGPYRGVLLPDVWKQVPDKHSFLRHLKLKAGLSPTFWSNQVRVNRFMTEYFSRRTSSAAGSPTAAYSNFVFHEPCDKSTSL